MIGNNIYKLRSKLGLTQNELGQRVNLTKSAINNYEKGFREPNIATLNKLAEVFNCSVDDIVSGGDPRYITINVYGFIPAGIPLECIEDIIGTEDLPIDMVDSDKQYFGLKIKGDSMEPEYLNNDIIILEKCSDAENGSDCVVMVNGYEGTFKRIKKSSSGITLLPLNKKYKPMEYSVQDIQNLPIRIIGKVVELRRRK